MKERLEAMIGRGRRRGLARHVPRARRPHPAPPRRGGRPQVELHDPRQRRPAAPLEADHRRRQSSTSGAGRRARCSAIIERWKDRGLVPDKVPAGERRRLIGRRPRRRSSTATTRSASPTVNAVDFGDLLLHNLTLFTGHPEILAIYQRRFRYLLVDEYQDTNVAQYLWLRLLAQQHKNLCCVGDDDQSIYSWRGAEIGNILRFESDFPGRADRPARGELPLDAGNPRRRRRAHRPQPRPARQDAVDPRRTAATRSWCAGCGTPSRRRAGSATRSRRCSASSHALREIAILVRAGFQTREFEERFIALALPYRVIGGPRFYERQEIRDALAYLRLVHQPGDDLAFERIVNMPRRGIGTATLQLLHAAARAASLPLVEAARAADRRRASCRAPARNALAGFLAALDRWRGRGRPPAAHRSGADRARRIRLYRDVAGRQIARRAGPARKPQGAGRRDGRVREPRRLSRACQPGHGQRRRQRRRHGQSDDAAQRQGARIRHGVSAGLGGGAVPEPALGRGARAQRPRRGAPPRLCRADPRAAAGACLVCRQPAHPRPVAELGALALHRRIAGGADRDGDRDRAWRGPCLGRRRGCRSTGWGGGASPGWGAAWETGARRPQCAPAAAGR